MSESNYELEVINILSAILSQLELLVARQETLLTDINAGLRGPRYGPR